MSKVKSKKVERTTKERVSVIVKHALDKYPGRGTAARNEARKYINATIKKQKIQVSQTYLKKLIPDRLKFKANVNTKYKTKTKTKTKSKSTTATVADTGLVLN